MNHFAICTLELLGYKLKKRLKPNPIKPFSGFQQEMAEMYAQ